MLFIGLHFTFLCVPITNNEQFVCLQIHKYPFSKTKVVLPHFTGLVGYHWHKNS